MSAAFQFLSQPPQHCYHAFVLDPWPNRSREYDRQQFFDQLRLFLEKRIPGRRTDFRLSLWQLTSDLYALGDSTRHFASHSPIAFIFAGSPSIRIPPSCVISVSVGRSFAANSAVCLSESALVRNRSSQLPVAILATFEVLGPLAECDANPDLTRDDLCVNHLAVRIPAGRDSDQSARGSL